MVIMQVLLGKLNHCYGLDMTSVCLLRFHVWKFNPYCKVSRRWKLNLTVVFRGGASGRWLRLKLLGGALMSESCGFTGREGKRPARTWKPLDLAPTEPWAKINLFYNSSSLWCCVTEDRKKANTITKVTNGPYTLSISPSVLYLWR
jgi:hypothetical protein